MVYCHVYFSLYSSDKSHGYYHTQKQKVWSVYQLRKGGGFEREIIFHFSGKSELQRMLNITTFGSNSKLTAIAYAKIG